MKKLLIIASSLGGGGTEVALTEFINHLDSKKYDITLLLVDNNNEYRYRLKKKIKIIFIKFDNSFYHSLASMYNLLGKAIKKFNLNRYFNIYEVLAKHSQMPYLPKFDVAIDFYGYGAFTTAFLVLNIKAKKKAIWLHDEQMPWIKNVDRYFIKLNKIFCVSKSVKYTFDKIYPSNKKKSQVLYNLVNVKNIKKKANEFYPVDFKNNIFNIVTVGRLTEQKGYDLAIRVAKSLNNEGFKFKWFVIGDGKDKRKLKRLVHKLHISSNFIFLGRKNNPYLYIKNCDLYVQPSRHEGFGLTVLEAKILDRPIIASNLPAFREQIIDGKDGIFCDFEAEALEKSIIYLFNNPKLRLQLCQNLKKENINFNSEINKFNDFVDYN